VLPYVALVQEKVRWLRNVVQDIRRWPDQRESEDKRRDTWKPRAEDGSVRVVGLFGGSRIKTTWADFDIAVCTIEKACCSLTSRACPLLTTSQANGLINTAINDYSISSLNAVVMDELHMINDQHRGYLLELLATKLLTLEQPMQIIGMSATLSVSDSIII